MSTHDWTDWRHILLFGGSFDPPHRAHVKLPELARQAVGADGVLYVPAARPPHKLEVKQTPAEHRLAMLRLALHDAPHAAISTIELDRAGDGEPSYTINTLEALMRQCPGAKFQLLIGADQAAIFDRWRRYADLERLAKPLVMVRPPDTVESVLARLSEAQRDRWRPRVLALPQMDVSSTAIRASLANTQADVAPQVARYISEHGLYASEPEA